MNWCYTLHTLQCYKPGSQGSFLVIPDIKAQTFSGLYHFWCAVLCFFFLQVFKCFVEISHAAYNSSGPHAGRLVTLVDVTSQNRVSGLNHSCWISALLLTCWYKFCLVISRRLSKMPPQGWRCLSLTSACTLQKIPHTWVWTKCLLTLPIYPF